MNASAGVGGTIWGESHAMLGVFGVLFFTIIWLLFVNLGNKHLNHHKPYSSFAIGLATYLAWYINRLDFNRVGQAFKITTFCFLMWAGIYFLLGGELRFGKKLILQRDDFIRKIKKFTNRIIAKNCD